MHAVDDLVGVTDPAARVIGHREPLGLREVLVSLHFVLVEAWVLRNATVERPYEILGYSTLDVFHLDALHIGLLLLKDLIVNDQLRFREVDYGHVRLDHLTDIPEQEVFINLILVKFLVKTLALHDLICQLMYPLLLVERHVAHS